VPEGANGRGEFLFETQLSGGHFELELLRNNDSFPNERVIKLENDNYHVLNQEIIYLLTVKGFLKRHGVPGLPIFCECDSLLVKADFKSGKYTTSSPRLNELWAVILEESNGKKEWSWMGTLSHRSRLMALLDGDSCLDPKLMTYITYALTGYVNGYEKTYIEEMNAHGFICESEVINTFHLIEAEKYYKLPVTLNGPNVQINNTHKVRDFYVNYVDIDLSSQSNYLFFQKEISTGNVQIVLARNYHEYTEQEWKDFFNSSENEFLVYPSYDLIQSLPVFHHDVTLHYRYGILFEVDLASE
jgi:hypothetical protein